MKRLFFLIPLFVLVSCGGNSSDSPEPTPTPTPDNQYLTRMEMPKPKGGKSEVITHLDDENGVIYSFEWDHDLRAQRWTCFEINSQNSIKKWSRSDWKNTAWGGDPFQVDPQVPKGEQIAVSGELNQSFYPGTNANYQRGHICASEDRVYSQTANLCTFYMTNMMPQVGAFNSGIWQKMEERVRGWAKNVDNLYVCKGGTIDKTDQVFPTKTYYSHIVPRYFYMALLQKKGDTYKALGFWVEHLNEDHSNDNLGDYVVNIDKLEELTGIDFFCNLPDDIENQIESVSQEDVKSSWGLR